MTDRTMDRWRRRGGVALAAVTAGATGLMLVPVAEAAAPPAQSTAVVCAEVEAGSSGFGDIAGNTHEDNIECVAVADIARGTSATTFNPGGTVTRGQMASFIARTIDVANNYQLVDIPALPAEAPDQFTDDEGNTHEASINRLAAAEIVNGKSATRFDPNAPVSRDQMATFIANAQRFLSAGAAPFGSADDYFVDDEANVHEANINAIAGGGIAQGVDGVRYQPNSPVLRSQMATFLARYLGVLQREGVIAPIDGEVEPPKPPPTSNATLTFGPTSEARILAAVEPSSTDDRTYTATDLSESKEYRVTLFELDSLSITEGPVFVFTEQGDSGFADPGDVGARITRVNGTVVTATDSVGGIAPSSGQITVVVDGDNYSRLVPVIHEDQGGGETALNLDEQNQPSEPFGVAGVLEVIPAEASPGILEASEEVLLADEDIHFIVAGPVGGATNSTYAYDTNDEFYLGGLDNEVTLEVFEQSLNRGDLLLAGTDYADDPDGTSKFVLGNESPQAPDAVYQASLSSSRTAVIRVNGLWLGAQANVHLAADGKPFAESTLKTSATEDALPNVPGFQVVLTGLTPGTNYEFYVTQTDDGETSAPHETLASEDTAIGTPALTPPTLDGAEFTTARPADKVLLTFSETVAPTASAASKIKVVCKTEPGLIPILQPGTTTNYTVTEVVQPTLGDTMTVTLNAAAPSGVGDCEVQVAKDAVIDTDQAGNAAVKRAVAAHS